MHDHSIARATVFCLAFMGIIIIIKHKPRWMPLAITSLQVQDLIKCFPDEDSHVQTFRLHRPTVMTVGGLLALLQCPSCRQGTSGRVLCQYMSMSMHAYTQTLNIRQSVEAPNHGG